MGERKSQDKRYQIWQAIRVFFQKEFPENRYYYRAIWEYKRRRESLRGDYWSLPFHKYHAGIEICSGNKPKRTNIGPIIVAFSIVPDEDGSSREGKLKDENFNVEIWTSLYYLKRIERVIDSICAKCDEVRERQDTANPLFWVTAIPLSCPSSAPERYRTLRGFEGFFKGAFGRGFAFVVPRWSRKEWVATFKKGELEIGTLTVRPMSKEWYEGAKVAIRVAPEYAAQAKELKSAIEEHIDGQKRFFYDKGISPFFGEDFIVITDVIVRVG